MDDDVGLGFVGDDGGAPEDFGSDTPGAKHLAHALGKLARTLEIT